MRTAIGLAAALAAVIGFTAGLGSGAWADDHDEGDEEEVVELEEVEDVLEAMEALAADLVSPAEALDKAAAKAKGVAVELNLGSEPRDGRLVAVWEIGVLNETTLYEVYVDAKTGEVFAGEEEDVGEHGPALAEKAAAGSVSLRDAAERVANAFAGALVGVELEIEGGVVLWEATFVHDGRLHEVLVRAADGKFVPDVEDDEEDEEDDEHDAEDHEEDDD